MPKFNISITPEAIQDIDDVYDHIFDVYLAPDTAIKYREGIYAKILSLANNADIFAFNPFQYIQSRYGPCARTIVYKKVTIVYTIHSDDVVIRAVIPGSIIH
jgi:plasmid stabilization system protein ParE